ncbi:MAG: hypothetical protein RMH75_07435 [Archaeoglobaceae archaeon]|nr:hypothetical protein [Archaeoglobaceae archaeon]
MLSYFDQVSTYYVDPLYDYEVAAVGCVEIVKSCVVRKPAIACAFYQLKRCISPDYWHLVVLEAYSLRCAL